MDFSNVLQRRYSCRALPMPGSAATTTRTALKSMPPSSPPTLCSRRERGVDDAVGRVLLSCGVGVHPAWHGRGELVAMINVGYFSEESALSAMHGTRIPMGEFVTKL